MSFILVIKTIDHTMDDGRWAMDTQINTMRILFLFLTFSLLACNDAEIKFEEVRQMKSLDTETFNKVLRREHDLAMEGMELIKRAGEDTAAGGRLLVINEEINEWRDLVKEKLPEGFQPSAAQQKMFEKVIEFQEAHVNMMRKNMTIGE